MPCCPASNIRSLAFGRAIGQDLPNAPAAMGYRLAPRAAGHGSGGGVLASFGIAYAAAALAALIVAVIFGTRLEGRHRLLRVDPSRRARGRARCSAAADGARGGRPRTRPRCMAN